MLAQHELSNHHRMHQRGEPSAKSEQSYKQAHLSVLLLMSVVNSKYSPLRWLLGKLQAVQFSTSTP